MALTHHMIIEPDVAKLRLEAERAGYYPPGAPVSDQDIWDYSIMFWEMFRVDQRFRFTPEYATEVVRRFFLGRATHGEAVKYANMPGRWIVLQRIQVGLIAILGRLQAEANWRQIAEELWPETDAPPSSALGREESAWWTTRSDGAVAAG